MALTHVVLPEKALGKMLFQTHVESIGTMKNRGRTRSLVVSHEVYEVVTADGSFTVKVPVKGAIKGDFYQQEVRLIRPKIVIKAMPFFSEAEGRTSVRPRLFVEADQIEIVGGTV